MFVAILVAIGLGFLVAISTGGLLGTQKALGLPGGSVTAGLGAGLGYHLSIWGVVFCTIAGLGGWAVYFLIFRNRV